MITQRVINPEFGPGNQFMGFISLVINDMNHVIDPNMEHDDLMNLLDITMPFLEQDPQRAIENMREGDTLVTRINNNDLGEYRRLLDENRILDGGPRQIREVVAVIAEIKIIPHGNFNIAETKIFFHCDTLPP